MTASSRISLGLHQRSCGLGRPGGPTGDSLDARRRGGRHPGSMRRLRSLIVEIHPPTLASGLEAALGDLTSPLPSRDRRLGRGRRRAPARRRDRAALLPRGRRGDPERRAAREREAPVLAGRETDGRTRLEVVDDGAGFTAEDRERSRADGHVGLVLVEELAARMDATLDVQSTPGHGTSFVLEVPAG